MTLGPGARTGRTAEGKYFGNSEIFLAARPKSVTYTSLSRSTQGRIAIVTDARRDAVDAGGASDEGAGVRTAKSCGPDASTLAFKFGAGNCAG
jgi:hypothetical protein